MDHVQGKNRNYPLNQSLEDLVTGDSFARIIDAFVASIDLSTFDFKYFDLNEEGRPPYHPSVLLKLYLYGYQHGIRSSRKLAQACAVNLEVMWLLECQQPCFKTISDFRKNNKEAFREVFRSFVLLLREWKLIGGKTITVDSFKIRAQNSLKNNYNGAKIERQQKYLLRKIAEYESALEAGEAEEAEIAEKIKDKQQKQEKYTRLAKELKRSEDGQLSTTDPDARAVVFQRNSVQVGYNIQAASDAKHKLLVAMDTGDVNDTKALSPMVVQVQGNINKKQFRLLADKGYHNGRELKASEALGVKTYVSPKASSSSKAKTAYAMDKFKYNKRNDTYSCPAGEVLRTNGNWYNKKPVGGRKSYQVKHYKTKSCRECPLKAACTKSKNGRTIERSEYQEYITDNNKRVNNDLGFYRQRQQLIEHQFGTLKRQRGFDHTLLGGKDKVLAEVSLSFICYNLSRTVSILNFSTLLRRLKSHIAEKWSIFVTAGPRACIANHF